MIEMAPINLKVRVPIKYNFMVKLFALTQIFKYGLINQKSLYQTVEHNGYRHNNYLKKVQEIKPKINCTMQCCALELEVRQYRLRIKKLLKPNIHLVYIVFK